MVKIVYVVSSLKRAGPTNQLYNLIKYLKLQKFRVAIITLSIEPIDSRWEDFKDLNVELYTLGLTRLQSLLFSMRGLKRILLRIKPDIIHSQGIRSDALVAKLNNNVKKICTIRNLFKHDYKMTYGALLGSLMTFYHSLILKNISCCVGVSQAVYDNIKVKNNTIKSIVIPNGVDTEIYYPVNSIEKKMIRDRLHLPDESIIWISVGHLSKRKNPNLLISAWKKYFSNDRQNILLLIGDGPLRENCVKQAQGYDNIIILGRINNIANYLRASDYYISASRAEGMPNAVLEAIACGLPYVLSGIAPHHEIWVSNEKAGVLFAEGLVNSFYEAQVKIQERDYNYLSRQALKVSHEYYSAKRMSNAYQKLYIQLHNMKSD